MRLLIAVSFFLASWCGWLKFKIKEALAMVLKENPSVKFCASQSPPSPAKPEEGLALPRDKSQMPPADSNAESISTSKTTPPPETNLPTAPSPRRRLTSLTPLLQMSDRAEALRAYTIKKIVSGGQTGVDRAALDAAMDFDIPVGGWCPKGRKAEDGPIDIKYPLKETNSSDYEIRTMFNARDSHGTLILTKGTPTGGTALTIKWAKGFDKDYLVIDLDDDYDLVSVKGWLFANHITVLNIAGPRASKFPGIYNQAKTFLEGLLGRVTPV